MRWRVAAAVQICGGVGLRRLARGCEPGYGGAEQRWLRAAAVRNSDGAVALSANRAISRLDNNCCKKDLSGLILALAHFCCMHQTTNYMALGAVCPDYCNLIDLNCRSLEQATIAAKNICQDTGAQEPVTNTVVRHRTKRRGNKLRTYRLVINHFDYIGEPEEPDTVIAPYHNT
ncbi:unnamed protein product [Miscanthus lutarioriparius]|uniref:Uncharacterized protein n=1 Tax=Miscanthus lutarioriparius TaxID=422564 RepID=A0A811N6Q1_9POAL|nr:unnamed protein product [Miscanthus lutarioriparius]